MRWYLRYPLSYEHVAELVAERGVEVDASCVWRWVQAYAPELKARLTPTCVFSAGGGGSQSTEGSASKLAASMRTSSARFGITTPTYQSEFFRNVRSGWPMLSAAVVITVIRPAT